MQTESIERLMEPPRVRIEVHGDYTRAEAEELGRKIIVMARTLPQDEGDEK